MGDTIKSPGNYRVEISGWGIDNNFFVEKTDLSWTSSGEKSIQIHRSLHEGAIVFVRLLSPDSPSGRVPVAYRITDVDPMDCSGRCQMKLAQLHPQSKVSIPDKNASNKQMDSPKASNVHETNSETQGEEVLQ